MAVGIKAKVTQKLTVVDITTREGKNGDYRVVDFATMGDSLTLFVFDDKAKLEIGKEYEVSIKIRNGKVNFENSKEVK